MNSLTRTLSWATPSVALIALAACGSSADITTPGAPASVTVYPVLMGGTPNRDVAEAVGLLLERGGLEKIALAEAAFTPDTAADFEGQAEAFGAFASAAGIATDYALLAAFDGTPEGVTAVRGALVDRGGKVLWRQSQRPGDQAFDAAKPSCPLTCSVLLVQCLQQPLALEDPERADAPEGKLAEKWRQKSGVPTDAERTAMAERLAAFRAAEGATVLVYPPRVGDAWCADSAKRLAEAITARGVAPATAADAPLQFEVEMSSNQQKVLWSAARSIQAAVRTAQPETDYVVLADFMISPRTGEAVAVHSFVLEADGDWVIVDFQNSHHADFQAIAPASKADCCELAAIRLAGSAR